MARYMSISVFGTDTFLRHQIERRLHQLKNDDLMIASEGVESLTIQELQQACSYRGIRTVGVSPARLRSELTQWLDLHLKFNIPSTILLLSRAFSMTERIPSTSEEAVQRGAEALQATLTALPDQVLNEAALKVSEEEGTATYKQKLNVLQEQEELIADELEQEASNTHKMEAAKKRAKELEMTSKEVEVKTKDASNDTSLQEPETLVETKKEIIETDSARTDTEIIMTDTELQKLGDALKTISSDSALDDVKEKLVELKEDHKEFKEDIVELTEVTQREPAKSTTTLSERVNKMISKLEKELAEYDTEIGSKLNIVRPDVTGSISIEELKDALNILHDHPDDERIKKIVNTLDADKDGRISLDEIMALVKKSENEGHGVVIDEPKPKQATPAIQPQNESVTLNSPN
ncbi:hypothetical protein HK096_009896 [Nowakowskiella sp. JEL0078]|nr:hypothetical protein HK096_009896 [Nowakowskiella sp. JEL0078]